MFTEKEIGALIYDEGSERMDIRFGLEEYYGGFDSKSLISCFVCWVVSLSEELPYFNANL